MAGPTLDISPEGVRAYLPLPEGAETLAALALAGAALVAGLAVARHAPGWWQALARPAPRWLGGLDRRVTLLALLALGPLVLMALLAAARVLWDAAFDTAAGAPSFGLGALLVALLGLPFVIWRSLALERQTRTGEHGHITDRINTAVQNLGATREKTGDDGTRTKSAMEIRIGGIYALERVARERAEARTPDGHADHLMVMEILCAYVRENAPAQGDGATEDPGELSTPGTDIQTVIDVLARRSERQREIERAKRFRLNLSGCDLSRVHFRGGDFSGVLFYKSRIEGAILRSCSLRGAIFIQAFLNFSDFMDVDMTGTHLTRATISRTYPNGPSLQSARTLAGAVLLAADLSGVELFKETLNDTIGSQETKLEPRIDHERHTLIEKRNPNIHPRERPRDPFSNWENLPSHDLIFPYLIKNLRQRLGLTGFPFDD